MFTCWKRLLILVMFSWLMSIAVCKKWCDTFDGITFLSYFPCTDDTSVDSLGECDIFAYTAARLAVDTVNKAGILGNNTLKLLPVATSKVCLYIRVLTV